MEKITKDHPLSKNEDIVAQNLEKLKDLFPTVIKEGKIDTTELKAILGEHLIEEEEYYNFTWAGKSRARAEATKPGIGTLRPDREESKNWEDTENLFIEGDNLEALKILQRSYSSKVKMIYIDPPYNTGKDFVYKDNYKDNLSSYLEQSKQVDKGGLRQKANTETDGRFHSNWLNMMYPRLMLARNLLTEDGVIFISIDDHEQANLKKLCDEIFGEQNFVSNVIWEKKYSPQNDAKWFSDNHDHILVYAKLKSIWRPIPLPRSEKQNARYTNRDKDPRGPWKSSDFSVKTYSKNYDYPITTPSGRVVNPPKSRCWRTSKENYEELVRDNRIWFGENGDNVPSIKRFLSEVKQGIVPLTIWKYSEVGHNQDAAKEIRNLFDGNGFFDTPKPLRLLNRIIHLGTDKNSLILDFFSGSCTTAHACMKLNLEDGGRRRFIMVQLDESADEKSAAYRAGYRNIAELSRERIRRAGDLIVEENKDKEGIEDLDIGFKAFKLDSSNISAWNPEPENLDKNLLDLEVIKEDRTAEDVLYEILLRYGIDLTTPILEKDIDGRKVFSVGFGQLFVCMEDRIDRMVSEGILRWIEEIDISLDEADEPQFDQVKVVFKDAGFQQNEVEKTNTYQLLVSKGVRDVRCI